MHVHLEHERGEREHDRLKHHRSQEAPEPFAGENGRAGERGRLQAHQRAVRAFDHESDRERHDAADQAPHDTLREGELEGVTRSLACRR